MNEKILLNGGEALSKGAIDAGCLHYFGYPITPQNEIPEYLSAALPRLGGVFIQAESELAAINMVIGAAAAGARVMTTSSSPGISLMQEALSYMAAMELPAVLANIVRGGPGLGGISASQGDYHQATRGGGHGDYKLIVLAPHSVQEMYDLTREAFDLADRYRNPVIILADAILGQMKEPLVLKGEERQERIDKPWALTGAAGRPPRMLKSLYLKDGELPAHNWRLCQKYALIKDKEVRLELDFPPGSELLVAAFGSCSRMVRTAVERARRRGLPVAMARPVSLFPFPEQEIGAAVRKAGRVLVVEMNTGQMLDDLRLAGGSAAEYHFKGFPGSAIPVVDEIEAALEQIMRAGELKYAAGSRRAGL